MRYDEPRLVWTSLPRGRGILCERRVARRRGASEEECEPNPKPKPKPNPSSADVAERGVASIGVRSSGNLCVEEYV